MRASNTTAMRLIAQLHALFDPDAMLIAAEQRDWASATFSGARHRLEWLLPAESGEGDLPHGVAALPEHEFHLPGQIVADCASEAGDMSVDQAGRFWRTVHVELLTVTAD